MVARLQCMLLRRVLAVAALRLRSSRLPCGWQVRLR